MTAAGADAVFVRMLPVTKSFCAENSAWALAHMAQDPDARAQIRTRDGVLDALKSLQEKDGNAENVEAATAALAILS